MTIVKNRRKTIRRCVESVLAQDYPNVEHVIQDRASTDGTLGLLEEFKKQSGDRISLESLLDTGATPAYFRALSRCSGMFWCVCMSDEEIPTGTLTWAVKRFTESSDLGVVYGDAEIVDFEGNTPSVYSPQSDFTFEKYLIGQVRPIICASFWRLEAMLASGLTETDGAGEVEQWLRVAAHYPIRYFPRVVCRSGYGQETLTNTDIHYPDVDEERHEVIINQVLEDTNRGRECIHLKERAHAGVHLGHAVCLLSNNNPRDASLVLRKALLKNPGRHQLLDVWEKAEILRNSVRRCAKRDSKPITPPPEFAYDHIVSLIDSGEIEQAKATILFLQDEFGRVPFPPPITELDVLISGKAVARDRKRAQLPIALNTLAAWLYALLRKNASLAHCLTFYKGKHVYIYGGGELGRNVYEDCRRNGVEVSGVIDLKGSSIQTSWKELKVYSPVETAFAETSPDLIILALYREEQEAEARNLLNRCVASSCPLVSWQEIALLSFGRIS